MIDMEKKASNNMKHRNKEEVIIHMIYSGISLVVVDNKIREVLL
jgi:hypothetical protein